MLPFQIRYRPPLQPACQPPVHVPRLRPAWLPRSAERRRAGASCLVKQLGQTDGTMGTRLCTVGVGCNAVFNNAHLSALSQWHNDVVCGQIIPAISVTFTKSEQ